MFLVIYISKLSLFISNLCGIVVLLYILLFSCLYYFNSTMCFQFICFVFSDIIIIIILLSSYLLKKQKISLTE